MTNSSRPRVLFAPKVLPVYPSDASGELRRQIDAAVVAINAHLDSQSFATDRTTALRYAAQVIFMSGVSTCLTPSVCRRHGLD